MTDKFSGFARLVNISFQEMVKDANVFAADIDGDVLYGQYLAAFPEGTNPLFRKNTEHDCSCCKQFIRRAGIAMRIDDQGISTVWDRAAAGAPAPYAAVATHLRNVVVHAGVRDLYVVGKKELSFGAEKSRSFEADTGKALSWNHFYTGDIPAHVRFELPDTARGAYRTTVQVFERGLIELSQSAVETVISLIKGNSLYRGEEHKRSIVEFQKAQNQYFTKPEGKERKLFAWKNADNHAARFRNNVLGTLVQDLSEGKDLEEAVRSYEVKVAPQNYKRTTSLITPGMVKEAMKKIEELGLEPALERRFAVMSDISINDVKWVDGAVKPLMKGGIGSLLMEHAATTKGTTVDLARIEDIPLDDFMAKILPETSSMEILFRHELAGNLMSLTAPVHPEPKQLFRWNNDFAWSYGGNVADSIKERVKKAGGKVTGVLRVSLSWFNSDDLDLHIHQPHGRGVHIGSEIYFGAKKGWTGGTLDVDMNAHHITKDPVENVIWPDKVPDGSYRVVVHNFNQRTTSDPGFAVEIEDKNGMLHYAYNKAVRFKQDIHVGTLVMKNGVIERVEPGDPGITASHISQDKWGLKTEQYAKVSAVTLSPNYWGDNHYGNKHTFFLLEGCTNEEETRGFYNEFLHPRLEEHRKVFEVIADKTKCPPSPDQLSGLGFSSTKKESFVIRAQQGKKQRVFNVHVGA